MFYKNARIFTPDFRFVTGGFEVQDGRFGAVLPEEIPAARYHSLAAKPDTIPDTLKVVGATEDGEVMAVAHTSAPVYGLQFHPESILTPDGRRILENFLADKPL